MLKVIYFDEDAAMDYINIISGGKKDKTISESTENNAEVKIGAEASIGAGMSFFDWFKTKMEAHIDSDLVKISDKLVTSTITTTILTDYIESAKSDDSIKKFPNAKLQALNNSLTFIKMYLPYTKILKDSILQNISDEIDITKFHEILDDVKGYYEFKTIINGETIIFRFNINSFRNNYKISDLLKMNLTFYGVKVGQTTEEQLNLEKEFEIEETRCPTVEEILSDTTQSNKTLLDVYDIVLAGVTNES